jgi:colanic acid/amylovoran biosynthesis glycosyltransferase
LKLSIITSQLGALSETFVTRHIRELNGGDTVVLFKKGDGVYDFDNPSYKINLPWWYGYGKPIRMIIQIPHFLRYRDQNVPDRSEQKRILNFIRRNNVKAMLAEFGQLGAMMVPVAQKAGIPIFTYFRGYDASKKLSDWKVRSAYRRMIPQMDGIFAVSPHLLDNLKQIGVTWKQAHVIPSGTDTKQFKPGEKEPNLLLSVGRFVPKKAPDITLRAFAAINERHPEARLVMIGDGPMLTDCRKLADILQVSDKVIFPGALKHDAICDYMARASIFMLHSVEDREGNTEGFPSVLQEAMASGCTVLSTRHGGIPHFVDHEKTGLLCKENDLDTYKDNLNTLLDNQKWSTELAYAARTYAVENFEYRLLYKKLESIIHQSVSKQA